METRQVTGNETQPPDVPKQRDNAIGPPRKTIGQLSEFCSVRKPPLAAPRREKGGGGGRKFRRFKGRPTKSGHNNVAKRHTAPFPESKPPRVSTTCRNRMESCRTDQPPPTQRATPKSGGKLVEATNPHLPKGADLVQIAERLVGRTLERHAIALNNNAPGLMLNARLTRSDGITDSSRD